MFATKYTFDPAKDPGEINNEPSMTLPDMSYTVRELLEKFTRGVDMEVMKNGNYDDEPDFDSIDPARLGDFDLTDLTEMELELKENLRLIREAQESAKLKAAESTGAQPPAPDEAPAQ